MTKEERINLIDFCVTATAELNGIFVWEVDRSPYEAMDDATLEKEADWLDDILGK